MPVNLDINEFEYQLPTEKIAKYPLAERGGSLLLHFDGEGITKQSFSALPQLLATDDFLIFNNTKVIQARLHFVKSTGAVIEVFCLEPYEPSDYGRSFSSTDSCLWKVMVGNLRRWKDEVLCREVIIDGESTTFEVRYVERIDNMNHIVAFSWDNPNITFARILQYMGELPIPPYLNRCTAEADMVGYQTTFAKNLGSVAAPTAGLHFTEKIISDLHSKGIGSSELTLHIGAGTFQPVKTENIANHTMHTEIFEVKLDTLYHIMQHLGHIVAVGTTSMRTLESLYYIGCHIKTNRSAPDLNVSQWEAYDDVCRLSVVEALQEIIDYMSREKLKSIIAKTQIMIVPTFRFRIVDKIITNFHQPRSTLLMLVSAFVGSDNMKSIYDFALNNDFRFLSYGDSSLLHIVNVND